MNVYQSQKAYFKTTYEKEKTPWPNSIPTPQVNEFLSMIKRNLPTGKMLDMGCGEGRHSVLFQENGFISFGVDYQPRALKKALFRIRESSGAKSGGPYFLAGDIFNLPFSPQNFDVILDYGCLHHIRKRDFKIYLGILLKMLRPGGFYILSCFSTGYKHYPGEKRTRDWLTHKGHYDRFFNPSDFPILFGADFDMMSLLEEKEGIHEFFHVLMKRK